MAKRGNNEGSIYRRSDGRWAASLDLGWIDGKRRRKHFYGRTRRDVATKLHRALQSHAGGLPVDQPERLTVGAYLDRWLATSTDDPLRPRTAKLYRSIVEHDLKPAFGRVPLVKLTPDMVQAHLNNKAAEGLSPYTVRNHRAVLRRALNQAVRWGLLQRNVAQLVTPPRIPTNETQPLTTNQAREFLGAINGHRLEALYRIAFHLGLRQGEILGLTWGAVDLSAGTVTARRALVRYDGAFHLDDPKPGRSRRTVALPAALVDALRQHRTRQIEERLRAGPAWCGNEWDLVFRRETGEPISNSTLTKQFQALLARAGLPRHRFHDLRHGAASFMLAEGASLRVVMEVLGHSDIGITGNIYGHVQPEVQREAVECVDALLRAQS